MMAFWDRRRHVRKSFAARPLECRLERLESRLLLAGGDALAWQSLPLPPAFITADASTGQSANDLSTLSNLQIAYGEAAALPIGSDTSSVAETISLHSTLATAQLLPGNANTAVFGTLSAGGTPAVYQVPLDGLSNSELQISVSWVNPTAFVPARVRILSVAGEVLADQEFTSTSLAIDLQFNNVGQAPGPAIDVEIVPNGADFNGPKTAHYVVRAQSNTAPQNQSLGTDATTSVTLQVWNPPATPESALWYPGSPAGTGTISVPSAPSGSTSTTGSVPSAPSGSTSSTTGLVPSAPSGSNYGPLPGPTSTFSSTSGADSGAAPGPAPMAGSDMTPRVILPLPQTTVQPVGGIFVTEPMLNASTREVPVVADLSLLDLAPAVSSVTATILIPFANPATPTPRIGAAGASSAWTWTCAVVADREDGAPEAEPGDGAPSPLTFVLPPAGVRVADRAFEKPTVEERPSARAALPRFGDEPAAADRTDVPLIGEPVPTDEPAQRRSRAVFALLYGSVCSFVAVAAPDLVHALRRAVREWHEDADEADA